MNLLDRRAAFMAGVARGMGGNHVLGLAREGASIDGIHIASTASTHSGYPAVDVADTQLSADMGAMKG